MQYGAPQMIITNQDPAMSKAFAEVMPSTLHRFCMWHILSKFSEKINAVKWKDHYQQFHNCIWNSKTPEEFDSAWTEVMECSGLSSNAWLKALYDICHKWIPAYVNHTFSAGMSSSQRSESCHAFYKRYVSKRNTLMDFVVRFTRTLKHQRHQELSLDHKDINEQPMTKTIWPIEKSMGGLYTQTMFYQVQDKLFQSRAYMATIEEELESLCFYRVVRVDGNHHPSSGAKKVIEDRTANRMTCSCKKFESCGIFCRHIFASFSKIQLHQPLPEFYLLRRWTKAAKTFNNVGAVEMDNNCDANIVLRNSSLHRQASNIIDVALLSEEAFQVTSETFETLQCTLNSMTLNDGGQSSTPSVALSKRIYNEPEKVRAKECGKRLKGGKEIGIKKSRRYNGCGLTGQTHDKRNCAVLNNLSSQQEDHEDDG